MSLAFETAPRPTPPYKLFAVVPGALLEVPAPDGEEVRARLRLVTPTGRRFVFEARGVAGEDGRAHLRVPYPTRSSAPVRARGAWRVHAGGRTWAVAVPERAVLAGERIVLAERAP
jgi:hypothetical protein